jgi:drug/metabolite transporter (DMT)-like permease
MLVALSLIWGFTWPAMKIALNELPPFSMRTATSLLGAATLCAVVALQRRGFGVAGARTWAHIAVAAILNIVGFTVLTAFAQISAATSRVAILTYTMPIWATLAARLILGEPITATRAIALALCAAGVSVLIYPLLGAGIPAGIVMALGAGASWAAGTVYLKWAQIRGDPIVIVCWQLVIGFLVVAACQPIAEGALPMWSASPAAWLAVAFTGVVGAGVAYIIWFEIVTRLPAATASLGILSAPVLGVVSSIIVLGERPTAADMVGFALILAAAACVLWGSQEAKRVQPEPG